MIIIGVHFAKHLYVAPFSELIAKSTNAPHNRMFKLDLNKKKKELIYFRIFCLWHRIDTVWPVFENAKYNSDLKRFGRFFFSCLLAD